LGVIQRQGIKNTIVSYSGVLLGFISLIIIQPKLMQAEEIGLMRILINFSSLIAVFMPLGVGTIAAKYFPIFRDPQKGHNGILGLSILFMMVGLVVIGTVLIASKGFIAHQYEKESPLFVNYYYCVIPLSFIIGSNSVLTILCNSIFKSTVPNFLNDFLIRVLTITLIIIHYFHFIALSGFVYGLVIVYAIQFIGLLLYFIEEGKPTLNINWQIMRDNNTRTIIGYGFIITLVSVSVLGLKFIDTVIMAKYLNLELVGIYSIAAFIPTVMETPLNALDRISSTKIAQALADKDHKEVEKIHYMTIRYLILIGGLVFIGINTNITFLMDLLPPKFHGGVEVVYIYSIGTLFSVAAGLSTPVIFLSDSFYKGALLMIGLVIFTVVCNVLLIPRLGMNGAALSITLTNLISFALRYLILYSKYKLQPYDRVTLYIIGLIGFCFGVNYFLPVLHSPILNMLLRGSLLSLLYVAVVYYLRIAPELFGIVMNFRKVMKR
jgi:O-antigen/teichoic acid export membrane protein